MRSIRLRPPRGMIRSTNCGMAMSWPTASRSVFGTSCTAAAGRPLSVSARCTSAARARFESMASEPPRRMQALPLLIDRLAASIVTLGRLSKIMPKTPIGTRICPTRMPLGCCFMPMISPITSGIAASCSQPWAQVSIALASSFRRSISGAASPAARARSRSLAFSCCSGSTWARSSAASARSTRLLLALSARAISADAALACAPRLCIRAAMLDAFMGLLSHAAIAGCVFSGCAPASLAACIRGTAWPPVGAAPATRCWASLVASAP